MDTMITHFTEKEKKRKNIHTNEKGDTVMYDENGRRWTLAGEFDTLEETERARNLLK
jgi:cation diffusion facilitator CzcD-associated flavoprotein CzcO